MVSKKHVADLLFAMQMIGAFVLCGTQFFRLLQTTQGQSLSMMVVMELYLIIHLMLAAAAHRAQPSRATRQTMWTFVMWSVLIATNIAAFAINGEYQWDANDTKTAFLAIGGTGVVWLVAAITRTPMSDPTVKSFLAMLFKSVPQLLMALKISQQGGAGLPVAALIAGHVTILIRIVQIAMTIREAGWDRNRVWLCTSEVANELSWVTVSAAWLTWHFAQ